MAIRYDLEEADVKAILQALFIARNGVNIFSTKDQLSRIADHLKSKLPEEQQGICHEACAG